MSWLAGGVVAALAAAALPLPVLQLTEARATDLLFRFGRRDPPRASPDIVHVDIDDNAIDLMGAYPWPRSRLAEAVRAVDSFGPKVIALDLLLDDPSPLQYDAEGEAVDHDAALARALAEVRARTVLGVSMTGEGGTRRSEVWETEGARGQWDAVMRALKRDVRLGAAEVVEAAGLDGPRADRVRLRLREFKRVAIREVVETMVDGGYVDEARVVAAMVPDDLATLGEFPELHLIRSTLRRVLSIRALLGSAAPEASGVVARRSDEMRPPLAAFSGVASAAGVVDADPDPDGAIRRIPLAWRFGGRLLPQFGLVAAAEFLGVPPSRIEFRADGVRMGRARLPTKDGDLLIPWPAFEIRYGALGLLRQHAGDPLAAPGHVGIGRVWDFRRKEALLRAQIEERDRIAREMVAKYLTYHRPEDLDDPERAPEVIAELLDQADHLLGEDHVPTDSDLIGVHRWRTLHRTIPEAEKLLAAERAQLTLALRDRLAFVGWNATGNLGEFYPTLVDRRTPGVVVHAMVANACLTGYAVARGPLWAGVLATLLLGALTAWFGAAAGPRLSLLLTLLVAVVFVAVNTLFVFDRLRTAVAWATPVASTFLAWAGASVARRVQERREKAQLRKQFGARVSPQLFEFLQEHPDLIRLEGEEREVTSYFSDLAGFTAISESLDPQATVSILNRYMWAMNDELRRQYAYVNKFLGDGIMAVWGAFQRDDAQAERACRAALECLRRLDRLLEEPDLRGLPRLSMRVGIATGVVSVGDCGAPPDLQDYTVIGNAVNLAARLESANKQLGTKVLVNGRTREMLPPGFLLRPMGLLTVVGQDTPSEIFELLALESEAGDAQRALVARTAEAVEHFRARRLTEARDAWRALSGDPSQAKLARLYLSTIEFHLARPDEPFDGVLRLAAK